MGPDAKATAGAVCDRDRDAGDALGDKNWTVCVRAPFSAHTAAESTGTGRPSETVANEAPLKDDFGDDDPVEGGLRGGV